jgi:phage terminase large subunit
LQGRNVLIVRKVARNIRSSCWNETVKAIDRLKLRAYFTISQSEFLITAKRGGGQLIFAGMDDAEKIKSLTPAHGVLTDVWMEEATECRYSDFKQLDKRLRGLSPHPKRLTMSFNPIYKTHWLYETFFAAWQEADSLFPPPPDYGKTVPGRSLAEGSLSILKTTYRDNRFLSPDDVRALETEKDPYYFDVYTRGAWGETGDVIFRGWAVQKLSPSLYPDKRFGLDFGFARDPTACICCAYSREDRTVRIFSELYLRGETTWSLASRLRPFLRGRPVICDSAEPRSIAELRQLGICARPARKGPDSVLHGIQWLRQQEIILSPACPHLREELSNYQWQKDADGRVLRRPRDRDNHLIDALRYALSGDMDARFAFTASKQSLGL